MKRWIVLLCTLVFILSMTGCGGTEEFGAGTGGDATEAEEMDKENVSNGNQSLGESPRPALELGSTQIWEGDTEKDIVYAAGSHSTLRLTADSQEKYPELSAALDEYMSNRTTTLKGEIEQYVESLKENNTMPVDSSGGYVTHDKLFVRRSDNHVLSILIYNFTDSGGAHGLYGYSSLNLDTASGKALGLEDVIINTDLLSQRIKEELIDKYGKDSFFDAMEETIDQGVRGEDDYNLTWTLDPQGITFFFNPDEIGPYASGIQSISLLYDQEKDLFTDQYYPEEGGYICELPANLDYYVDVDRDGKADRLSITYSGDQETGDVIGLLVAVNDQKLHFEDFYCYELMPKLVFASDGKVYLDTWRTMDNDYVSVHLFDLSDGIPISIGNMDLAPAYRSAEEDGTGFEIYTDVLTDPENLFLTTRFDLLSTYDAGKTYQIHDTPNPVSEEKYYTILRDLTLTSKMDVTADLVDEAGNVTESSQTIPSGSSFKLYRTDGKKLVDALLDDGRIVRFTVAGDNPQTANDINAEELFQGLFYAG